MYLSMYMALLTSLSLGRNAVSRKIRRANALTFESIATLHDLKWWQQVQGGLMVIAALCSLYLLSMLGVETEYNRTVQTFGGAGMFALMLSLVTGLFASSQTIDEQQQEQRTEEQGQLNDARSVRAFTTSELEEGMLVAGLV
ncbi:hypothetical protein TrLO_g9296 [Triparma laevis f. longispina]|uniref:Uncharacterized protein n=2 Tax=Triparma laevis f. longispina TaxID=1714387 RepID=A0A9W7FF34_9STRA|nr:hypothetical protein TrLO_g9296 [Triparma laevis f. longispina]